MMRPLSLLFLVKICLWLLLLPVAYADESSRAADGRENEMKVSVTEPDRAVMEKARTKSYKGGGEEGELRVQAQLPQPQRKISPIIDRKNSEKETQEHD